MRARDGEHGRARGHERVGAYSCELVARLALDPDQRAASGSSTDPQERVGCLEGGHRILPRVADYGYPHAVARNRSRASLPAGGTAEREGFEPSRQGKPAHAISSRAP